MKLEKEIEKKVCVWAKDNDWLTIKFTPKGEVGWPDRIFISPKGTHVWIEFKRPGKKPKPMQLYRNRLLVERFVRVGWFDDAKEAINYLETFT